MRLSDKRTWSTAHGGTRAPSCNDHSKPAQPNRLEMGATRNGKTGSQIVSARVFGMRQGLHLCRTTSPRVVLAQLQKPLPTVILILGGPRSFAAQHAFPEPATKSYMACGSLWRHIGNAQLGVCSWPPTLCERLDWAGCPHPPVTEPLLPSRPARHCSKHIFQAISLPAAQVLSAAEIDQYLFTPRNERRFESALAQSQC